MSPPASGVVALAGSAAVRLLADRVGLTGALSTALARRSFVPVHDRGRVLVVATVLVAGGEAIADIDTLRHEPLWVPVASPATVRRAGTCSIRNRSGFGSALARAGVCAGRAAAATA